MPKPDYDTTVARIAGNIASGFVSDPAVGWPMDASAQRKLSEFFVSFARAIVAEVKRTEPLPQPDIPRERCENGLPDCGPPRHRTADDVPLCQRCWQAFKAEGR